MTCTVSVDRDSEVFSVALPKPLGIVLQAGAHHWLAGWLLCHYCCFVLYILFREACTCKGDSDLGCFCGCGCGLTLAWQGR